MSSQYVNIPGVGNYQWKAPVDTAADLPTVNNLVGDVRVAQDTSVIYVWNGSNWVANAGTAGVSSLNALVGAVTLAAGTNVTLGTTGNTITINSTASGTGTVTSVALAEGSATPIYSISGSPITTSGTLTFTLSTQAKNLVFAGPSSGSNAQPTFRSLVLSDFPSIANDTVLGNISGGSAVPSALTQTQLTTLINTFTSSLSGAVAASGGGTTNFLRADGSWSVPPGSSYTFADSIVNSSGTVTFVNDSASPGNSKYYGTDSGGTKGYFTLPAGSVTSVAMTVPASIMSVSGSPITSSGTLAVSLATQSANMVWAGPTTGSAAQPTFRALVTADMPSGTGTVTSVGTGTGLTGGTITTTGTISLANIANNTVLGNTSGGSAAPTAQSLGTVTESTSSVLTLSGWADATLGSPTIQVKQSSGSVSGYLSSTDWTTFNNKQSALTFSNSLVNSSGTVTLVNDSATPGNNKYYGTNGSGTLGYYSISAGSGTVTSVDMSVPSFLSVSGNPITTSGTLAVTLSGTALPVANGGTGATSLAAHGVLVGEGTSAVTSVTGNSGTIFASITSGTDPGFVANPTLGVANSATGALNLANGSSAGIINISNGGAASNYNFILPTTAGSSGQVLTSQGGGSSAMTWSSPLSNPMTTTGDIITAGTGGTPQRLAIGSTGNVLTVSGGAPVWAAPATSGTVTSVAMTVPSFLSVSGSPITSSGTLAVTLSGTALPVANGGTGQTSFSSGALSSNGTTITSGTLSIGNGGTGQTSAAAAYNALSPMTTTGDIEYESGTNTASRLAIGSSGQVLTVSGGVPAWVSPTAAYTAANNLLNSQFRFCQRFGASGSTTIAYNATKTFVYVLDRWANMNNIGTTAVVTVSQVTSTVNQGVNAHKTQITTAAGTPVNTGPAMFQFLSIGDSDVYYGQNASFSCQVKAFGNVNSVSAQFVYCTSANLAAVAQNYVAIGSPVTTSVNTSTYSTLSITNQAIGTSQGKGGIVGIMITVSGVSSGHYSDLNNGYQIEIPQMNIGTTVAQYAPCAPTFAGELSGCQGFYEQSYNYDIAPGTNSSRGMIGTYWYGAGSTGSATPTCYIRFATTKQQNPTIALYTSAGTLGSWGTSSGNQAVTTNAIGETGFQATTSSFYAQASGDNVFQGQYTADAEWY